MSGRFVMNVVQSTFLLPASKFENLFKYWYCQFCLFKGLKGANMEKALSKKLQPLQKSKNMGIHTTIYKRYLDWTKIFKMMN